MSRFAEVFTEFEIVSALMRQLGWGHFLQKFFSNEAPITVSSNQRVCELAKESKSKEPLRMCEGVI